MPRAKAGYITINGQLLAEARRKKELTQAEVARAIGVGKSFICELEKNPAKRIDAAKAAKLEKILDLEPRSLQAAYAEQQFKEFLELAGVPADSLRFDFDDLGLDPGSVANLLSVNSSEAQALMRAIRAALIATGLSPERVLAEWIHASLVNEQTWKGLEKQAAQCIKAHVDARSREDIEARINTLASSLKIEVRKAPLRSWGGQQARMWSISFKHRNKRILVVNQEASPGYTLFLMALEAASRLLAPSDDSSRSYPEAHDERFKEKCHNYRARYLAAAMLVPSEEYCGLLKAFLEAKSYKAALVQLSSLLEREPRLPAEPLFNRLVPLLRLEFGFHPMFLHMTRERLANEDSDYVIRSRVIPRGAFITGFDPHHHFCRRWNAIRLLDPAHRFDDGVAVGGDGHLRFQKSEFVDFQYHAMLNISLRVPSPTLSGLERAESMTIALPYEDPAGPHLVRTIRWSQDEELPFKYVGLGCEVCSLHAPSCKERVERIYRHQLPTTSDKHNWLKATVSNLREVLE